MIRMFSTIIGLLILAVVLPKVGDFLAAHGWPVAAAMDAVRQSLDWFWRELRVIFA